MTAEPPPPDDASSRTRDRYYHSKIAAYGNYHNYYFHRIQAVPDARLALLPRELFENRTILDLGCNAGKLTIECVKHLGARRAHGIDIDDVLIEEAQQSVSGDDAPAVTFECADFMQDPSAFFAHMTLKFDTILLLSITKWLHLHHGDEGLRRLFDGLARHLLPPDGVLIVEPQEWDNYKRAVKKNRDLRETFRTLELRPPFDAALAEAGFKLERTIEREEGGFSRPLMIWRRV